VELGGILDFPVPAPERKRYSGIQILSNTSFPEVSIVSLISFRKITSKSSLSWYFQSVPALESRAPNLGGYTVDLREMLGRWQWDLMQPSATKELGEMQSVWCAWYEDKT